MYLLERIVTILQGFVVFLLLSLGSQPTQNLQVQNLHATASAQILNSTSKPIKETNSQLGTIKASSKNIDAEQYVMEPHPSGEEGFYVLKNTPNEPMTTNDELNTAVNQYRAAHGLNTLAIDNQLCDIANQRAIEASTNFSHDGFKVHIEGGDYNYTGFVQIGENLWQGSFSGVHIVGFGWDRSVGHRANLQGDWSRGCAGIYQTTVAFIFAK